MTHNEKKVGKIVEELTMYLFAMGAEKIESSIEKSDGQYIVRFRADYNPDYRYNMESMKKYLNQPKNEAMEDIYWELAGSGDPGESSQLLLVGMMIDRFELKKYENEVEVTLYKQLFF